MNFVRLVAAALALVATACAQQQVEAPHASKASDSEASFSRDLSANPPPAGRAAPAKPSGRGLPAGALRAQMVQVMDMNGFAQPLPALFGFVPVGWRAQGGVQWGQQFACTNGYNFSWMAQSPDGLEAVAILPQQKWESNNYGAGPSGIGCPLAQISSMQQYLQQLVGSLKPGARLTNYRARPDLAAKFANLNSNAPSATGDMRTWVESGEVQFSFNEQGRDMRGIATATGAFSMMRNAAMGPAQVMISFTGFVFPGFAATGPAATFKPQMAEAIRQSFLPNPSWQALIARHNSAISRMETEEARKRSQAITEYNDYVSMIRRQTADTRAASDERRNRQFGETIRGTQSFDDANAPGGRAELSGLYDNAWRLNDGTYVLSNDASFEPFRDLGVDGRKLQPTQ